MRENLKPKGFQDPTIEALLIASHEESVQFEHVIADGFHKAKIVDQEAESKVAGKIAIDAGKYCLRICRNNLRAMKEIKKYYHKNGKVLPKGFNSLLHRIRKFESVAVQLERCKRKSTLNKIATVEMLTKAITERFAARGENVDTIQIKADIGSALDSFEYGGKHHETPMKNSELMDMLMDRLSTKGYVESTFAKSKKGKVKVVPKDHKIRRIIEARIGYQKEKAHRAGLIEIHDTADWITLSNLSLTTAKEVRHFSEKVMRLGQEIRNFALDFEVLQKGSMEEAKNLNFMELLFKAQERFKTS